MSSDPDSNGNIKKSKAFIRESYITGKLPNASYITGVNITLDELKEKYGFENYIRTSKVVNNIINRSSKNPTVSKKIHS